MPPRRPKVCVCITAAFGSRTRRAIRSKDIKLPPTARSWRLRSVEMPHTGTQARNCLTANPASVSGSAATLFPMLGA